MPIERPIDRDDFQQAVAAVINRAIDLDFHSPVGVRVADAQGAFHVFVVSFDGKTWAGQETEWTDETSREFEPPITVTVEESDGDRALEMTLEPTALN